MTVIAYKDGVIASDSQVTSHGIVMGYMPKVAKSPTGWIGGASGDGPNTYAFVEWIKAGADMSALPDVKGELAAMLVSPKKLIYNMSFEDDTEWKITPYRNVFEATGSGYQIALGAMEMGGTAEDAVRAAIKWNRAACGGKVQKVVLNGY